MRKRRLATLDLLAGERLGDEVEARAAVLLGDDDAEDSRARPSRRSGSSRGGDRCRSATATGRMRSSTNERTVSWSSRCSPVSPKSTSRELIRCGFPHRASSSRPRLALIAPWRSTGRGSPSTRSPRRLPPLSVRHPRRSLGILFSDRAGSWPFVVGVVGWVSTSPRSARPALARAGRPPPAGLALLAFFAQRASGEPLPRREWLGVAFAVVGLLFLRSR